MDPSPGDLRPAGEGVQRLLWREHGADQGRARRAHQPPCPLHGDRPRCSHGRLWFLQARLHLEGCQDPRRV